MLETLAYLGKQCAAERTQFLEIMDPPQTWPFLTVWMSTCHGHAPSDASTPPTMRFASGGLPHTCEQVRDNLEYIH